MILHIISKGPDRNTSIERCLMAMGEEDGLLLIQDGVYQFAQPQAKLKALSSRSLYYLQPDLEARGLTALPTLSGNSIDYSGFVELVCKYSKSVSWF